MQKLEQLRKEVEKTDAVIIEKLAERQKLVKEIGQLKAEAGIGVLDVSREAQLLHNYQALCEAYQLDPAFVKDLFEMIFSYSRSLQK